MLEILTERFGFENLELDWFRFYHTGRTQTFTTPSGSSTSVALMCSFPQGSVIGPKEFIMYTENIKETIDWFIINDHLYADDSQLLPHMKINAVMEHRRPLETCVKSLRDWYFSRLLQLNPDKTKLIWFGTRANLVKLRQLDIMSLNLCSVAVEPVDSVRDLSVILDSELSMRVHISKISSTCFFHLRRLRKLCPLIDTASAQRLVSAFMLSRVDYCNAVLAGLPTSTLAPLQRILNAAACFVAGATSRTHVSGIMKSLHWLPIAYRIRFKLCVLMHGIHNGTSLRI